MSEPATGPCAKACSQIVEAPPAKGAGPSPQARHLPGSYRPDYLAWVRLPISPYPPGGRPSGGAQELSISSEEWARRARQSPCYRCELAQQVKAASRVAPRLKTNWMFWTGLGAGALGVGMLVVMKR